MTKLKLIFPLALLLFVSSIFAEEVKHSTVGVQGYDLVSYQKNKTPLHGNGNFVSVHEGVRYLFINEENKMEFDRNPSKYLPAYGGWCAFGVAVGKKFTSDPNVYEVVDGKLYLNLDNKIKGLWLKDMKGNIKKSEANWMKIKNKNPKDL